MAVEDAPWSVDVRRSAIVRILDPGRSVIKKICAATRCEIDLSWPGPEEDLKAVYYQGQRQFVGSTNAIDSETRGALVKIFIRGSAKQRVLAAKAIRVVESGGDLEDELASLEGALVISRSCIVCNLDDWTRFEFEREAWTKWQLFSVESEHNVRIELNRHSIRIWARIGGPLNRENAQAVQTAVEAVLAASAALTESFINVSMTVSPEVVSSDPSIAPLAQQHGIIVRLLSASGKIHIVGPREAVQDATLLLVARFVDGNSTSSVLQTPGQIQSMPSSMARDFELDLKDLEAECSVKVHRGQTALWITGSAYLQVVQAKKTLQEMLQFYQPDSFALLQGHTSATMDLLQDDDELRTLAADSASCVVALDAEEGSVWVCGQALRTQVKRRIDEVAKHAMSEHFRKREETCKRRRMSMSMCFWRPSSGVGDPNELVGQVDLQCPVDVDRLPEFGRMLFDQKMGLCDIWPGKLHITLLRISNIATLSDLPVLAEAFLKASVTPAIPYVVRGDRLQCTEQLSKSGGWPFHLLPIEIPESDLHRLQSMIDRIAAVCKAAAPHVNMRFFGLKDLHVTVRKKSVPWKDSDWPHGMRDRVAHVPLGMREFRLVHPAESFHCNDPRWPTIDLLPPMILEMGREDNSVGSWGSDPYGSGVTGIPAIYIVETLEHKRARLVLPPV